MANRTRFTLLVLIISLFLTTGAAAAGSYTLDWWTTTAGGGTSQSAGGDYTLRGTVGQWDAGGMVGGDYSVQGGFWVQGILTVLDFLIHLPLVFR